MAGAAEILPNYQMTAQLWVLVPNRRGAEMAVAAGASRITVTVSASPVYSEKNVNMTVDESLAQVAEIRARGADGDDRRRGVVLVRVLVRGSGHRGGCR